MDWPAALTARPQLIAEAHAFELRDAWLAAERVTAVSAPRRAVGGARYQVVDGVAVIPISGALLNRYDFLGDGSPYSSYSAITGEVNRAASDTSIRAIVLAVNSPGGNADGILAPAAAIRAARKVKPVTALVGSIAASGGYWLASQAGEIVLQDDLSAVGSIGVYTLHLAFAGMLEKAGIDVSVISSGAHKVDGHPFAALPDPVRKQIQGEVDDLRVMFARERLRAFGCIIFDDKMIHWTGRAPPVRYVSDARERAWLQDKRDAALAALRPPCAPVIDPAEFAAWQPPRQFVVSEGMRAALGKYGRETIAAALATARDASDKPST